MPDQNLCRFNLAIALTLALAMVCVPEIADATNYRITTTAGDTATNGNCTLREAIRAARGGAAVDACAAGSASNLIELEAEGTYSFLGGEEFLAVGDDLTIRGLGASPDDHLVTMGLGSRFLNIFPGAQVTLEGFTVVLGLPATGTTGGLIASSRSDLTLRRMVMSLGSAGTSGGCLSIVLGTGNTFVLEDSRIAFCGVATSLTAAATGGAMSVRLGVNSNVELRRNVFESNEVEGGSVTGGAVSVILDPLAQSLTIEDCVFRDNVAEVTGLSAINFAKGGGLSIVATTGDLPIVLKDTKFYSNRVERPAGSAQRLGAGLFLQTSDLRPTTLDRLLFDGNTGFLSSQIRIEAAGGSTTVLADTVIVHSRSTSTDGVNASVSSNATLLIDHLTVSDTSTGIDVDVPSGTPDVRVTDTLFWSNSFDTDLAPGAIVSGNLSGVDPLFVGQGNYRVAPLSPAVDAGNGASPGLQLRDLDGRPRTAGPSTDVGAYERQPGDLFIDGFESGDTSRWSS